MNEKKGNKNMARTRRIKSENSAFYHVMSRITGKRHLLKNPMVKEAMVRILEKVAAFSGVNVGGYAIMDNHFHLVIQVPKSPESLSEDEIFKRIARLKGSRYAKAFRNQINCLRAQGLNDYANLKIDSFRKRMQDLSQFVKTFKEYFNVWYKSRYKYTGSLWAERFKSTIIEEGRYLSICREYIERNPVRAGLAKTPSDYAWCTEGAAKRGNTFAKNCREFISRYVLGLTEEERQKLNKRIIQISLGKIFGSREYVCTNVESHLSEIRGSFARIKDVVGLAFSSHGHKHAA